MLMGTVYIAQADGNSILIQYAPFHAPLAGLMATILFTALKLNVTETFLRNNLKVIFISFGVIAPLIGLPFVLVNLPSLPWNDWTKILEFFLVLLWGGQLYLSLIPIQIAITLRGDKTFLIFLGFFIVVMGFFNILTAWLLVLTMSYFFNI